MAELTGFVPASQDEIATANSSNDIARGTSPFQNGVVFTVIGFSYEKPEVDGKVKADAKPQPVLTAKIGDKNASLFVKALNRSAVRADGSVLEHNGTFNQFVRETIASLSDKNNGEILQAICAGCAGRRIIVERVPYSAKSKDGRNYASSLVDLNFVVD